MRDEPNVKLRCRNTRSSDTNKLSSCMGTTVATAKYALSGYIDWHLGVFCAAASLAGASLGANIALLISESAFRMLMHRQSAGEQPLHHHR